MVKPASTLLVLLLLLAPFSYVAKSDAETTIRELHGPIPPSRLPPFAATSALLLVVGFFVWSRRRKKMEPISEFHPEYVSPSQHDTLIQQLENIRQQQLSPKELIERLMPVIRGFLAERIGASVGHLTSEELIAALQRRCDSPSAFQREYIKTLIALLQLCDAVRFGAVSPTVAQAEWALTETMSLLPGHNGKAP